jgi:hypothetical protein
VHPHKLYDNLSPFLSLSLLLISSRHHHLPSSNVVPVIEYSAYSGVLSGGPVKIIQSKSSDLSVVSALSSDSKHRVFKMAHYHKLIVRLLTLLSLAVRSGKGNMVAPILKDHSITSVSASACMRIGRKGAGWWKFYLLLTGFKSHAWISLLVTWIIARFGFK